MIRPSLEEMRALSGDHDLVLISRDIVADGLTPVLAHATLGGGEGSYLLESVAAGETWSRYSFVGFAPDRVARGYEGRIEWDGTTEAGDPFAILAAYLASQRVAKHPTLPRFAGGAVGYVSYDAVRAFEPSSRRARGDERLFTFAIGGPLLVFDDLRQTVTIVVPARTDDPDARYRDACARIDEIVAALSAPKPLRLLDPPTPRDVPAPTSSFGKDGYCDAVRKAQEHIRAGDAFQIVLSQRFRVEGGVDLFDVYRALRVVNPSPYMFFVRFPEIGLAGASPETLVRVEDGHAEVRPLAGTRRRGAALADDARIAKELLDDPKERAEHVMLVDLGRNDLGRIAKSGTVRIGDRMVVERYSHVMHIVSSVRAEVREGVSPFEVLAATFPAGTLSGAPKVRAMQIIDALEPEPRGVYGGAVGYVGWDGNLDFAIAIRTVVEENGELRLQAGAGIVEASVPEAEHEECVNKARAALVAIESLRK